MGTAEIAALLNTCFLFQDMSNEDRLQLAARATRRTLAAGAPIFHRGDPGDSLFGILIGTVRISLAEPNGKMTIVADLAPGEVFGELALIDAVPRSADATAVTDCRLIIISRPDFVSFLEARPRLTIRLLAVLSTRLRLAQQRANDLLHLALGARLAKALLASPSPLGIAHTQSDLATLVGATRPKVNQKLKEWERLGAIALQRGRIVVLDRDRLTALASADQ